MIHEQGKKGFGCRLLFLLPFLGCLAIAQADCDNCLYGPEYCYINTHECIYGCQPGWKGSTCTNKCDNKACKECIIGDNSIEQCTRCYDGYYGPLCNLKCNDNCKRFRGIDVCDQFGNCHYGCVQPYTGPKCEDQLCPIANCQLCSMSHYYNKVYCYTCNVGYYWSNEMWRCIPCSKYCLTGAAECDRRTGECTSGKCKDSWFGDKCDNYCDVDDCIQCTISKGIVCNRCKTGKYPADSGRQCKSCKGQNCVDTCDNGNGNCNYGCLPGFYGAGLHCDRNCTIPNCNSCTLDIHARSVCASCAKGYHADQYQLCEKCSQSCKNDSCDIYSGKCNLGCKSGFYGDYCQFPCGDNCVGKVCNDRTGVCTCTAGWYGDRCNEECPTHCESCNTFIDGKCKGCEAGFHGTICEQRCSSSCRKSDFNGFLYCNQSTGDCLNGCYDGFYGLACNKSCSQHCDSRTCEKDTGYCVTGCSGPWYGDKCEKPCPSNCVDVTVGWSRTCSISNGRCLHGCKDGFYGSYCNKSCSPLCKNSKCDNFGECTDGCYQGYTGRDCSLVCGKNCPSACSPNCLQESCDQETHECVDGCIQGWYGTNCQEICSDKCKDRKCSQRTGMCIGPCLLGFYGGHCSYECSRTCVQNTCSKDTGYCTLGCQLSYHGPDCSLKCSDQCLNGTCDRNTGLCQRCGVGRRGAFCEQSCLPGTHGENCEEKCGNCKDYSQCYVTDGRCPSGCEAGWTGPTCSQALFTSESGTGPSLTLQIAIGCSVGGALCTLIIVSIICWLRKVKIMKEQKAEPAVMYSDAEAHIVPSVHQPCTTLRVVHRTPEDNCSADSNTSIQSQSAMLLGDCETGSQIRVLQVVRVDKFYTLHKGFVTIQGQTEECCVKFVQFSDLDDKNAYMEKLRKESEILSTCISHINIINMITTYQNTEVYCVAFNSTMQTGLKPYLDSLQAGSVDGDNIEPDQIFQLLQFTVDCCSAVCHLHQLKIIHRALQAGHVYLSDNMVAKIGDFEWAEKIDIETDLDQDNVEMGALPEHFFPWLPPESFLKKEFAFTSDVWTLGLLFWEIITLGKKPFDGLELNAHQQAVMDGVRPSKPPLAHFTLYRLMKSCWRYDTEDRPTAQNLLQQLISLQGRHTEAENIVVHV